MFGALTVGYLFLGGAGAGAIVVGCMLDLVAVRAPFGTDARVSVDEAPPVERVASFTLLAGFAALVLGTLCLIIDLGRIDRVLALFLNPSLTYLTVGSYALAVLVLCGAFLALVRFVYLPSVPRSAVVAVEAVAAAVGTVVALYTGLLLQGLGAVALWKSPLLPVMFVLSSLSCGIAVALAASFFSELDADLTRAVHALACVDAAVIALEAVASAAFAEISLGGGNPAASASAAQLMGGSEALAWWVGFVLCGLIVPFVVEAVNAVRGRTKPVLRAALAVAAVLVLVGGLCMRGSVVGAGAHRALELEEPAAQTQRAM